MDSTSALTVELLAPAIILFVQQLKSKVGVALMLVLPSFHRVPRVSALVHRAVAATMPLLAAGCTRAALRRAAVRAGSSRLR